MPRLPLALLLVCAVLLGGGGVAAAAARPLVGIGEQDPGFFEDPLWQDLGTPYVRLVVAWDALQSDWQRQEVDDWMAAAARARARVLVTFGHSRVPGHELDLPSRTAFTHEFRAFLDRYPDVETFQAWNEANHGTQPTGHRPGAAAGYFDAMAATCPWCTISAPSVLDAPNMVRWISRFQRAARRPIRVWSVHNYLDANRFRTMGTRKLLQHVRGQIWFTETGGIVGRTVDGRTNPAYSRAHAARAVRQVFRLARLSRRITRVYFYNWTAPRAGSRWDSALMSRKGTPRPAYDVLRREVRRRR